MEHRLQHRLQHCLNFLPDPQGQGAFRSTFPQCRVLTLGEDGAIEDGAMRHVSLLSFRGLLNYAQFSNRGYSPYFRYNGLIRRFVSRSTLRRNEEETLITEPRFYLHRPSNQPIFTSIFDKTYLNQYVE